MSWRFLAILVSTSLNCAAVDATRALILVLAHARVALSWAANWAESLLRAALASRRKLAILWSQECIAFSRSLRAFLAFSLIWAALAATCLFIRSMRALVADAHAEVAVCHPLTARRRFLASSRRSWSAILMVRRSRLRVARYLRLARRAFLAFTAILCSICLLSLARAAALNAKSRAI